MIQDTSSQDVVLQHSHKKYLWLKIGAPLMIIVTLFLLALPGISDWSSADISMDRDRIRTAKVQRGEFIRDIALQGSIIAANSPKIYAPAQGTVTLLTNPGGKVSQGEIIARVDSPTLTNRLQQEQASLKSLAIELQRMKITAKQAKIKTRQQVQLENVVLQAAERERRRAEESIKLQAISQLDYEKAIDDLKRSQLKYAFAVEQAELEKENLAFEIQTKEFQVDQFQLQVANTERLVSELDIQAPVDGIVGSWSIEQKAAVEVNQPLLTVVDLSAFQVEVDIPESFSDNIGLGMSAKVNYNGEEFNATIVTISPEVINNIVKGRVAFTAKPPPGIKQNQRVSSRIILEQKTDTLFLPRGSFVQHHAGRKIFVVENNVATLTEVTLGSRSVNKIEVLAGLKEGQEIVLSNTDFVQDAEIVLLN